LKDDIQRLVRLQDLAFKIREAEALRSQGPKRIEELEEEFQRNIEEIGAARLRHEELVNERKALRERRESLQRGLEQGQQKLMSVNNQREYSAVLNEIDSDKQQLAMVEQRIAACEAEIAELAGPAAEADERIQAEREKIDREKGEVESSLAGIDEKIAELKRQSDEIRRELPDAFTRRFDQIMRGRDGVALAPVERDACGACRMRVRPQVISLAKRGEDLVLCDSCRRILYIPDDVPSSGAAEGSESGERSVSRRGTRAESS
jgi:hypothetical protein